MARSSVEIPYQSGRGAARSKIEQYLVKNGFKQAAEKNGGTFWYLIPEKSTIIQCVKLAVETGTITLFAWITGVTPDSEHVPIGEEDLSGLRRLASKRKLKKTVKEIQKMFQ